MFKHKIWKDNYRYFLDIYFKINFIESCCCNIKIWIISRVDKLCQEDIYPMSIHKNLDVAITGDSIVGFSNEWNIHKGGDAAGNQ